MTTLGPLDDDSSRDLSSANGGGPRRAKRVTPSTYIGYALLATIIILAVFVPILIHYPINGFVADPFQPPSWPHPFGTDDYGRDVFVRTWAAARIDLAVAAVGVSTSLVFGSVVGVLVGSARRRIWDALAMRIVDSILAFPFAVLILVLVLVFGTTRSFWILPPGLPSLFAAIFVWNWAIYARLARAQTITVMTREYITAAQMLGLSRWQVLRSHILPNVTGASLAYAVTDCLIILMTAAGLPFLGAGVQPPTPEWGAMMFEGRLSLGTSWWMTILPGTVLALTGVALVLAADTTAPRRRHIRASDRRAAQ